MTKVFFIALFLPLLSWGQSATMVSHYTNSAFVSKRLLPFTLRSEGKVGILTVNIIDGENCVGLRDPHYGDVFHLYCEEPDTVRAEIQFLLNDSQSFKVQTQSFQVLAEQSPVSSAGVEGE
ncbi:MAG: hypothetical protein KDD33_05510 [Bdellovibrionales bacterium]|nr:hypothetical protein [Bdellovibrionales bacterium]